MFSKKKFNISIEKFDINPPFCVFLPCYTYQCGWKHTDIKLQTLQDKDMNLLLRKNNRGVIGTFVGW